MDRLYLRGPSFHGLRVSSTAAENALCRKLHVDPAETSTTSRRQRTSANRLRHTDTRARGFDGHGHCTSGTKHTHTHYKFSIDIELVSFYSCTYLRPMSPMKN